MLVLTRKMQEKIQIGDNVTITILRVKGQTVRVGIEAPRSLKVVRGELPLIAEASEEAIAHGEDADDSAFSENEPMSIELPARIGPAVETNEAENDDRNDRPERRRPLARFAAPLRRNMANFTTHPVALLTPSLAK